MCIISYHQSVVTSLIGAQASEVSSQVPDQGVAGGTLTSRGSIPDERDAPGLQPTLPRISTPTPTAASPRAVIVQDQIGLGGTLAASSSSPDDEDVLGGQQSWPRIPTPITSAASPRSAAGQPPAQQLPPG
jgi:hypothetical protein